MIRLPRLAVAATLALTLGVVAGCASEPTGRPTVDLSDYDPTATGSATGAATGPSEAPDDDSDGDVEAPVTAIPIDDPAAATAAADAFLRAYVTTSGVTTEQWYAGITPYLTPSAEEAYQFSDASSVSARSVTGAARIDETVPVTNQSAEILVPTDIGDYRVTVVRITDDTEWLVSRSEAPLGWD